MKRLIPYMALIGSTLTYQSHGETISSFPYSESFENGFGDWINHEFEGIDWIRHSGSTATNNTGPAKAAKGLDYIYLESSGAANANQTAYLEAVVDFSQLDHPAMLLSYHLFGATQGQLSVDIYDGEWYEDVLVINGQQQYSSADLWKEVWLDLGAWSRVEDLIIRIEGVTGPGAYSDIAVDYIRLINGLPGVVSEFPYLEEFENPVSTWSNIAADDFDWTVNQGPTSSNTTGPDQAPLGGKYMYTEASGTNNPFKAASMVAAFDLSLLVEPEFSFHYHMFGNNVGSIVIDIFDGTWHMEQFIIVGQQHDFTDQQWAKGSLDLTPFAGNDSVVVRLSAVTATTFSSDIAIDRIEVKEQRMVTELPFCTDFEQLDHGWRNVSGDDFDWFRNTGHTASNGTGPTSAGEGVNYLFTESSGNSHPQKQAILETMIDFSTATYPEMHLLYHMHGAGMGDLSVRAFTNKWINIGSLEGQQQRRQDQAWGEATFDLYSLAGWTNVKLQIVAQTGTDHRSDMAIDEVCIREATVQVNLPDCQTFETNMGSWINVVNDGTNWLRHDGRTPSANTGPAGASTGEHYIYLESSGEALHNKMAALENKVDLAFAPSSRLTFDYFMYGSNVGTLSVHVKTDQWHEIWSASGQLQNNANADWQSLSLDLSAYDGMVVTLRIEGRTTDGNLGDIALDNISIGGACFYWTGEKDINWHDEANWASHQVPTFEDNAVIPDVSQASGNFPVVQEFPTRATCNDIKIELGASLTVNKNNYFLLFGNLFNNGKADLGSGQLTFSGTKGQAVHGQVTVGTIEFDHVSTSGVLLFDDLTARENLVLRHGIVHTQGNTLTISKPSKKSLRQVFTSSFVNGKLARFIAVDRETYDFPVGYSASEGDYHPMTLINNRLQTTQVITVSVDPLVKSNLERDELLTLDTTEMSYDQVLPKAVWTVDPDHEPTGGSYGIRLSTLNFTDLPDNGFAPVKRPSNSTKAKDWEVVANTVIPAKGGLGRTVKDGFGERIGYTSFSQHGFAIDSKQTVLPVEMLSFSVEVQEDYPLITWSTATEINNDYFEVHASNDGVNFHTIALVKGAGTSTELLNYEVRDKTPLAGQRYYRVIQVDLDGTASASDLVAVSTWHRTTKIYPSAIRTGQPLTILSDVAVDADQLTVINALGQPVAVTTNPAPYGNQAIEVDTSTMKNGHYLAVIKNDAKVSKHPFVVLR